MANVLRTLLGVICFAFLLFGFANTRQNEDAPSAQNNSAVKAPDCPDLTFRPANLRNWIQSGFIKIAVNEIQVKSWDSSRSTSWTVKLMVRAENCSGSDLDIHVSLNHVSDARCNVPAWIRDDDDVVLRPGDAPYPKSLSVGTTIDFDITTECHIDLKTNGDFVPVNLLMLFSDTKSKPASVSLSFENVPFRKSRATEHQPLGK
jgi:hypothetical protein